ncbi:dienelactone hydrolase family protein [Arthrobacter sp. 24S4-2]|uniref:dienelactone hydrolase family protein n=1 Tax=Arthrobacter sp. 24S4-2 TaxID=2575374 RepID=UPI0010C774C0|nr:dienelactone hydrolase family protein [Arthrobacter sp. 24S4-2]QCO98835.1 dienelactone hydrolase family protein [Arthrobacter sp. 24S4-2]
MIQLGKYEKYLIEEFFDDYRAGTMSQHTFTRRVAFITGSMTAAAAAYLARPEGGEAGPAVLVCHENRGLTPHIKDVARRFAKAGYAALALAGLKATSAFYGPAPDLEKVPGIKAAVLGIYAELDNRITGALPALRDALTATGVRHELTVYPGVDHAFHNDTGDRYNEAQATAAWNDTLSWFGKYV